MELSTIGKSQFNPLSAMHVYIRAGHEITRVYRIVKIKAFLVRSRLHGFFFGFSGQFCIKINFSAWLGDVSTSSKRRREIWKFVFFSLKIWCFWKMPGTQRVK